MKKLILLLLSAFIALNISACGDRKSKEEKTVSDSSSKSEEESSISDSSSKSENENSSAPVSSVDDKAISEQHMKNAYSELTSANETLQEIASAVQGAWHYGIYEDGLHSFYGLYLATGVDSTDLENTGYDEFYLDDFSGCVCITVLALQNNGTFDKAKESIEKAKSEIQEATNDLEYYTDMKNYYSSCLGYYQWLESPTGNFEQATDTINDYNNELQEFKNDMEFDYGS